MASTQGSGITTITAQAGILSGAALLTVTAATPVSVQLSPATISLPAGGVQQLLATATFTDGSSQNVTSSVLYTTSNPAVAIVDLNGKVTAISAGTATISATLGVISASTPVTVSSAILLSISISPLAVTVAAGVSQQLTATGSFSDGSTQNLTNSLTWSSSNSHVATVSSTGNVVTANTGIATVTAASGLITGTVLVNSHQRRRHVVDRQPRFYHSGRRADPAIRGDRNAER